MPAIVRQTISRSMAKDLLTDIQNSSNEYYIGIGKSDTFNELDTVIDPVDSPREEREFRNNLQSIKKVEGSTFVARRVNWSQGTVYSGWDDATPSDIPPQYSYYVLNDAKEVYVCLSPGLNPDGTVKPSTDEPNWGIYSPVGDVTDPTDPMYNLREWWKPFTTPDGYVWKFLYSLTPERIYQFLSSNHIPVQEAEPTLAGSDSIEDLQWHVKDKTIGGEILRLKVTSAGSGFTAVPTVNIIGDGTGATATAHLSPENTVTHITMDTYGEGYTYASIEVIGGDPADPCTAIPVITSANGLGYNPIDDLKTSSIMVNIKPDGTVNDTFVVRNTFRQMGLIKNPLQTDSNPYTNTSAKVMPSITLEATSPFEQGKFITGATSGAKAYVNDSADTEVFYHQNESTGFEPFQTGEGVVQEGQILTGVIASITLQNVIDRFSGDVLYIENRARIRRDEEQQEDIKIVITV